MCTRGGLWEEWLVSHLLSLWQAREPGSALGCSWGLGE